MTMEYRCVSQLWRSGLRLRPTAEGSTNVRGPSFRVLGTLARACLHDSGRVFSAYSRKTSRMRCPSLVPNPQFVCCALLVHESKDLAANLLAASLVVVHDAAAGGQDEHPEETRRQDTAHPCLDLVVLDVVAGADAPALVDASVQLHHDLARPPVIHQLEVCECRTGALSVHCKGESAPATTHPQCSRGAA